MAFGPFGTSGRGGVLLSIVLLVGCIVGTLWLAGRVYRAGVLLYGQRPGLLAILSIVRSPT